MKCLLGVLRPEIADQITAALPNHRFIIAYTDRELDKAVQEKVEYMVIDEEIFSQIQPWLWLTKLRNDFPNTEITIILSDKTNDSLYMELIRRIGMELKISFIPPGLTMEELYEAIENAFTKKIRQKPLKKNTLISILGAAPKDGASTIAINTALALAEASGKKIGVFDLNLKSPDMKDQLQLKGNKGFPVIQVDCDAKTLTPVSLLQACEVYKHENLYVLTGLHRRDWAERIKDEEIAVLLQVARQVFDITLIDVHSFPDNAATVQAIKNSDERWVVAQPIVTSFQSSWFDWYHSIWQTYYEMSEADFKLIINRYEDSFFKAGAIEKAMGIKSIAQIPNASQGAGIKAVNYATPLFMSEEKHVEPFRQAITKLAVDLCEQLGFEVLLEVTKKGFFSKLNSFIPLNKAGEK